VAPSGSSFLPLLLIPAALGVNYLVQRGRSASHVYECGSCGVRSELSAASLTFAPHSMGRKYTRCPACGRFTWMTPVPRG